MSQHNSLSVFLSSTDTTEPTILAAIDQLGALLAQHQITLVYGASNAGLMGKLADATLHAGGRVIGILVEEASYQEIPHPHLTQLIKVSSVAERIALMQKLGDAVMVFPGGLGTTEELFSTWNLRRLGIYKKPLGIFNPLGFYDPLQQFLRESMQKLNFINETWISIPIFSENIAQLFSVLTSKNV